MSTFRTTKMSSKGQVVIPEEIRTKLGLEAGTQLLVVAGEGVVMLKEILPPSMSEFGELVLEARRQAREAGLRAADVRRAIRSVRSAR